MRFSGLLALAGTLGVVFGFGFLFAPAFLLQQYAVTTDASGLFMAQFFGASLIQLGLVFLFLKGDSKINVARIALGACIGELAGLWVALRIQLGGQVNALGWSTVAIYALLALGFARFAFGKRDTA